MEKNKTYWNAIADIYQGCTHIATDDFHYGPLMPGDRILKLLPEDIKGKRCLEIGCGAAQNSIYLAKQGAVCTAFDISEQQIRHARLLTEKEEVEIDLRCMSMDDPEDIDGKFDIIHSVYSISFSRDPGKVAKFAAGHLADDGYFLLVTGHPLAQCEWLEVEDEQGIFLPDYFNLPPDIRYNDEGKEEIRSLNYPISVMTDWICNAGMCIERIIEPMAKPAEMKKSPYYSDDWAEYMNIFCHVPAVVIFLCRKK